MEFTNLIAERYSCKNFDGSKTVDAVKLNAILEAGRLAPTAKNQQEQKIYVVQSEAGLQKIDAATPCRYSAPICLVVAFDRNHTFPYPGGKRNSGMEDASIVATHMMLAAANEGVDSCWLNFFDPDKLAEALELPENEEVLMILDLGYAAEGVEPLPNHTSRKPLSEPQTETLEQHTRMQILQGCAVFCVLSGFEFVGLFLTVAAVSVRSTGSEVVLPQKRRSIFCPITSRCGCIRPAFSAGWGRPVRGNAVSFRLRPDQGKGWRGIQPVCAAAWRGTGR